MHYVLFIHQMVTNKKTSSLRNFFFNFASYRSITRAFVNSGTKMFRLCAFKFWGTCSCVLGKTHFTNDRKEPSVFWNASGAPYFRERSKERSVMWFIFYHCNIFIVFTFVRFICFRLRYVKQGVFFYCRYELICEWTILKKNTWHWLFDK